jgi:multidrug efflux pump subunit AcrA (membrane-fusion protein)
MTRCDIGCVLQGADVTARRALQEIHDTYWLVNIVDNDYVVETESIFTLFREVITDAMSEAELRLRVRDLEADNTHLRETLLRLRDTQAVSSGDTSKLLAKVQRLESENEALRAANDAATLSALTTSNSTDIYARVELPKVHLGHSFGMSSARL